MNGHVFEEPTFELGHGVKKRVEKGGNFMIKEPVLRSERLENWAFIYTARN